LPCARIVPRPCGNNGWRQHRAVLNKVPFQAGPSTVYVAGPWDEARTFSSVSFPWSILICYVDPIRDSRWDNKTPRAIPGLSFWLGLPLSTTNALTAQKTIRGKKTITNLYMYMFMNPEDGNLHRPPKR